MTMHTIHHGIDSSTFSLLAIEGQELVQEATIALQRLTPGTPSYQSLFNKIQASEKTIIELRIDMEALEVEEKEAQAFLEDLKREPQREKPAHCSLFSCFTKIVKLLLSSPRF